VFLITVVTVCRLRVSITQWACQWRALHENTWVSGLAWLLRRLGSNPKRRETKRYLQIFRNFILNQYNKSVANLDIMSENQT
jgi:hypothetical protein